MDALPIFVDSFLAPVRDDAVAQVAIVAVLLLMLLDIAFGIGNALATHSFTSAKMREGIGHKCVSIGFILVGIIVDGTIAAGFDIGVENPVLVVICAYLAIMEVSSLLETFAKMNPSLAQSPVFRLLESSGYGAGLHDDGDGLGGE